MKKLFTLLIAAFCAAIGGAADLPDQLFVVGDATFTGAWDNNCVKVAVMIKDVEAKTFTYTGYLTPTTSSNGGAYFRFATASGWHDTAANNYGPTSANTTLTVGVTSSNFGQFTTTTFYNYQVAEAGNYKITCDFSAESPTIKIEKAAYTGSEQIKFNVIYLIGGATLNGWTTSDKKMADVAIPMYSDLENDPFNFKYTGILKNGGESLNDFKFTANTYGDNWSSSENYWFYRRYTADYNYDASTNVDTESNDDVKWKIHHFGKYTITLNPNASTCNIAEETWADAFNVYFKNTPNWSNVYIHYWGGTSSSQWESVSDHGNAMTLVDETNGIWAYTLPAESTGFKVTNNTNDDNANKTADITGENVKTFYLYTPAETAGDGGYTLTSEPYTGASTTTYIQAIPTTVYLAGTISGNEWATSSDVEGAPISKTSETGIFSWENVELSNTDKSQGAFSFITVCSTGESRTNWETVSTGTRFGSLFTYDSSKEVQDDLTLSADGLTDVTVVKVSQNKANFGQGWIVPAAKYDVKLDLTTFKMTLTKVGDATNGIAEIGVDADAPAEYYNLQGIRVAEPTAGKVYIVRRGATATKLLVR